MKKILTIIILLALGYLGFTWFQSSQVTSDIKTYEIQSNDIIPVPERDISQELDVNPAGDYGINKEATILSWRGKTSLKSHHGTVDFSDGFLNVTDSGSISGLVSFNMASIRSEIGGGLDGHLKNKDFFDVENYPVSTFVIHKYESGKIFGELTIRNITNTVELPVDIDTQIDTINIDGEFTIDRTLWGIEYNSGSIFSDLGDRAIHDDIQFSIKLEAQKNG